MRNIPVAIGVLQDAQGKILLTQRFSPESPSVHLQWQLPGGEINKDETPSSACVREFLEETGYTVEVVSKEASIIVHPYGGKQYTLYGFKVRLISGTINVSLDVETNDAKWFDHDEWKKLKTLDDTREMIEFCLK
jgi:8-oxo-dGTP diphosphatase